MLSETTPFASAPRRGSSTPPRWRDFRDGQPAVADLEDLEEYAAGPWVLELPWRLNPLPANGSRGHHFAHAKTVKMVRRTVWALALAAKIPPQDRAHVQLTYYVRDRRRRDVDNLVPLLKPVKDGLVDAGLVRDDTPDLMATPMPVIVRIHPSAASAAFFQVTIATWPQDRDREVSA